MPVSTVYTQIRELLRAQVDPQVSASSLERLTLLVVGIIRAKSAAPAQVAQALHQLGLSDAKPESIERRLRRIENDPDLTAALCVHPLARERLLLGRPTELRLILDPTTQEDRVVLVSVAVWYRGRALPLAWVTWPGNTPLKGDRFWLRIAALLDQVAPLLPQGIPITWLADRAFGTPAFLDLLTVHGWHYVVRLQAQTRVPDHQGRIRTVRDLVRQRGQRAKLTGRLFKKRGWRTASVVIYWGPTHRQPLCVVSDLPPRWDLLALYRRRYAIEATFRDYKSHGWRWEEGQVTDADHLARLLVGMALATWVVLLVGTQVAQEIIVQAVIGQRRTVPWAGKRSLFQLGLARLHQLLHGQGIVLLRWQLDKWEAPHWQAQIYFHYAHAWVFTLNH